MRHSIILAGAAALAITAPVLAKPGNGNGNGGGGNKGAGAPAKVERGGEPQRAERGGGPQKQIRGPERGQQKVDRRPVSAERVVRSANRKRQRTLDRSSERQVRGGQSDARQVRTARGDTYFASSTLRTTGLVYGCPPGLAAKGNGCLPPGQAKKLVGAAVPAMSGSALLPPLYRNWYPDNEDYLYRTDQGYVYRVDRGRNLVDAYWPLADEWDNSTYVGAAYPQDYLGYYNVPTQYQGWYADNGDDYYRYGDGAIYQVDREGGVIEQIVSLLAGGVAVGQPLPDGYDVYNVPTAYRDRYVDSPDAMYRYNDGYIYEVDPTTRIVEAIVQALA